MKPKYKNYQVFSQVYQQIFDESLYDQWADYVQRKIKGAFPSGTSPLRLLDLACGDGRLAVRLAQAGYQVSGIDLSEEMVDLAEELSVEEDCYILFQLGDMRNFEISEKVAVVTLFCDSLCYLKDFDEIKATFSQVYQALEEKGLFLFDIHSAYQMNQVYPTFHWVEEWEDAVFTWRSEQVRGENTIDHCLNIFVQEGEDYHRYQECHQEQIFAPDVYKDLLEEVGFHTIEVSADFKEDPASLTSRRLFFKAEKG